MKEYLNTPIFGFALSVIAFQIGLYINKKTKNALFNPLIIAIGLIMALLIVFDIDYEVFNEGGNIITFFLGPTTVVLALPLYRQLNKIKGKAHNILIGIAVGSIASFLSVIFLSKLLGIDEIIILSLLPKSSTTAISKEISSQIGGISSLTIAATSFTGISGYIMGPSILKLLKIDDKIAVGIAMGTGSHASGTAKAMEIGEIEGGMASLAIGVAGLMVVLIAPMVVKLFFK